MISTATEVSSKIPVLKTSVSKDKTSKYPHLQQKYKESIAPITTNSSKESTTLR
jgi:hypothetical protein